MCGVGKRNSRSIANLVLAAAVALSALHPFVAAQNAGSVAASEVSSPRKPLDCEVFKTRVQPIFLKKRGAEHARCYACHEKTKHVKGFNLEKLAPGQTSWTEEQSRRNCEAASHLVVPGSPLKSMFLLHPLAPEGGGDAVFVHSGGRQFASQRDPDWQTMAAWVMGK